MTKKFRITYLLEVVLDEDSLWPDGDAPANPTAEDVVRLIREAGGFPSVIDEWSLDDGFDDGNFDVTEEP